MQKAIIKRLFFPFEFEFSDLFRISNFGFRILDKGFTLIEVLTTVVILSIGVIAMHQAFGRSIQAVKRSEEALAASYLVPEPAALSQLGAWSSSGALPAPSEGKKDFEGYPGFSCAMSLRNELMNGLNFIRQDFEMRRSGVLLSRSALLLPEGGDSGS